MIEPSVGNPMHIDPLRYHRWRQHDEAAWSLFDEWVQLMVGDLHNVRSVTLGEGELHVEYYVKDRDGQHVLDWERNPVMSTRRVALPNPPPCWPDVGLP
jgi:hypothetical protein